MCKCWHAHASAQASIAASSGVQGIYAPPGETITLGRAVATANNLPYEGWWATLGLLVLIAYMIAANILLLAAHQLMACAAPCCPSCLALGSGLWTAIDLPDR